MAEPIAAIGLVASVIQVANVARHVELTLSIIRELGAVFEHQETAELISESAVRTADGTVQEFEGVFREMAALVEKSLGRGKKLLFPFREAKIELLRANLERLKSCLQLLMQVLTHAEVVASKKRNSSEVLLQREHIKKLVKAKEDATRKYQEERVKYQELLERLNEIAGNEADSGLGSSQSSKVLVATLSIPSEQDEAVVRDRDLPSQSTSSLIPSRLGSADPELSKRRGISRSELEDCVHRLQMLLKQIEQAQKLLEKPTSIHTDWAVFRSYSDIRAVLDRYLLRKVSSDPGRTLHIQSELIDHNKNSNETSAGLALDNEMICQRKKHNEDMKKLQEEMKIAMCEKDEEFQREIGVMQQRLHKSIERANQDRQNMKASFARPQEMEVLQKGDNYRRLIEERRNAEIKERMRRVAEEGMQREKEHRNSELKSALEWTKKMEILRSDNELAKLLVEWTTISMESIKAA